MIPLDRTLLTPKLSTRLTRPRIPFGRRAPADVSAADMQAYMSLLGRVGEVRPSTPSGFLWVRNDDVRDKEHKELWVDNPLHSKEEHKWVEHWVSLTENRLKRGKLKGAVRRSLLMYDPKGALARFADDARELLHIGAATEVEVSGDGGLNEGGRAGRGGLPPRCCGHRLLKAYTQRMKRTYSRTRVELYYPVGVLYFGRHPSCLAPHLPPPLFSFPHPLSSSSSSLLLCTPIGTPHEGDFGAALAEASPGGEEGGTQRQLGRGECAEAAGMHADHQVDPGAPAGREGEAGFPGCDEDAARRHPLPP